MKIKYEALKLIEKRSLKNRKCSRNNGLKKLLLMLKLKDKSSCSTEKEILKLFNTMLLNVSSKGFKKKPKEQEIKNYYKMP